MLLQTQIQCDCSTHLLKLCNAKAHSLFISITYATLIPLGVSFSSNLKYRNALPDYVWIFFHKYLWCCLKLLEKWCYFHQKTIAHIALGMANSIQVIYGMFLCMKWFMLFLLFFSLYLSSSLSILLMLFWFGSFAPPKCSFCAYGLLLALPKWFPCSSCSLIIPPCLMQLCLLLPLLTLSPRPLRRWNRSSFKSLITFL